MTHRLALGLALALGASVAPARGARQEALHAPAQAEGARVDLELDLHLDRYAFARGELNGQATELVIDSGAGMTVVDQALAEEIGLEGGVTGAAQGVGGATRSIRLATASLRLGELALGDVTVAILDLGEVHERLGRRMPVILGKELFERFAVTFDYPARRLRVFDPEAFVVPADAVECETRALASGHVTVQLAFEDLEPGWFMVDTGSGDTLALHARYVEANELLARYERLGERLVGGVGGVLPAKIATAGKVTLAGQVFRDVPVTLATEHEGVFGARNIDGNLGAGLLARFAVTFDRRNARLVFEPGPGLEQPFARDRSGLALDRREGRVLVALVSAGSPAAAAGFEPGAELVAIDGEELRAETSAEVVRRALQQPAGTVVRLREAGGTERALTLADYF